MANYLYNGIELPAFPLHEDAPYMFLSHYEGHGTYVELAEKYKFDYYGSSPVWSVYCSGKIYGYFLDVNSDTWEYIDPVDTE